MDNGKFLWCLCGEHGVYIYDDDIGICISNCYQSGEKMTLVDKIRWIVSIIKGVPFKDMVIVSYEDATDLSKFIHEIIKG